MDVPLNDEVYSRLKEICPVRNLDDMTLTELLKDTNVAFKIIGYSPNNLTGNVNRVFIEKDHIHLYDFIYDVWRLDHE